MLQLLFHSPSVIVYPYLPSIFLQLFLYQCLFLPRPPTPPLYSSPRSSVVMTFEKRSSCFYMMARQYDNDTVLHYVSTLLGMSWETQRKAFS